MVVLINICGIFIQRSLINRMFYAFEAFFFVTSLLSILESLLNKSINFFKNTNHKLLNVRVHTTVYLAGLA